MIIRKIDSSGDWQFGKGVQDYATGLKAIEQNIRTRLLSWQNDCFYALEEGLDYRNLLDKGQQDNLTQAVKTIILASYGVTAVTTITATLGSDRKLSITYTADTIYSKNFVGIV